MTRNIQHSFRFSPLRFSWRQWLAVWVIGSVCGGVPAAARVFMRWGRADTQRVTPTESGWQQGQTGPVHVNGRTYDLQVYAARGSARQALEQFRRMYREREADVQLWPGGEMHAGWAVWPDRFTRALVVSPRHWPHPLVFLVHSRQPAAAAAPPAAPADLPVYPGARPGSQVTRPETGVTAAFWRTPDAPREVLAFYDQALGAAGWTPFFVDTAGRRADGPLAVYTKGRRLCYVQVSPVRAVPGEQMITVLIKDS